jgi:hypothetical protein
MMSQNLKRLAKIEAALAALSQKRKRCIFLNIERDWSLTQIQTAADELIAKAIASGRLDPTQHEPLVARFWTQAENDAMADKVWAPEAWEKRQEPNPRPPAMEPFEPLARDSKVEGGHLKKKSPGRV